MHKDTLLAWITFSFAGIGNARAAHLLLSTFGSMQSALSRSDSALRTAGLSKKHIEALRAVDPQSLSLASTWLAQPRCHLITCDSSAYPAQLSNINGAPATLYAQGDLDLLHMPALAIVGSRNPTAGGLANAKAFAEFVAKQGLAIVSGLASGIDAQAHRGALAANGATIAVLGCGIDQYYPRGNEALHREVVEHGVVISEYAPGCPARAEQFPARNRLISGLSLGTLVVEATRRSGSLITARLAGEQGRSIFAIPGSIHNPLAKGCHQLIRQGALLVEDGADIFLELAQSLPEQRAAQSPTAQASDADTSISAEQQQIIDALGHDPVSVDELSKRTGLTSAELSSMLLIMELEGLVRPIAGGAYQVNEQTKASK